MQRDSDDQSNVETSAAQETEDVAKAYSRADASSLVGTAPMIVTIEEVSMPYDLEARDLKVSSLFPLSKRAFCVRDREQLLGLANEALAYGESLIELLEANSQNGKVELDMRDEHAPITHSDANENAIDIEAKDEMLDEIVWHAKTVFAHDSSLPRLAPAEHYRPASCRLRGERQRHRRSSRRTFGPGLAKGCSSTS